jgi:succinyl-CoA synthetase beta subunit
MMLLEHDAKELLRALGLNVPEASLAIDAADAAHCPVPVVVKAQVPAGGRGKAGGIRMARTAAERDAAVSDILGLTIKGHAVRAVRLEQPVEFVAEAYVSFTIDAARAKVRILMSPQGGIDIEDEASRHTLLSAEADLDADDMARHVAILCAELPEALQGPVQDAAKGLIGAFFALEAVMLEINPLFITPDGGWMIGDAKLVADDNAFERCGAVRERIASQPRLYPEAALKLEQGFDFVRLDANGRVGLVTTGAGLSMQLVDELTARGVPPFNFCDIRTGMFRGDPSRLIQVLGWILEGPSVDVIMVNFFAGATDLAETTRLLLIALERINTKTPVVARLIGNNLDAALEIIAEAGNPITVETDLDRAIARTVDIIERKR